MFDFMDVSESLSQDGRRLGRYATVTRNELSRTANPEQTLLHTVDVMTGPRCYLVLEAHRLDFGVYCVQAVLVLESMKETQAVWTLTENWPPSDTTHCHRCLAICDDALFCPEAQLSHTTVPLADLSATLIAWMRAQFKADTSFQSRQTPA